LKGTLRRRKRVDYVIYYYFFLDPDYFLWLYISASESQGTGFDKFSIVTSSLKVVYEDVPVLSL